jgi:hypothetical protein
MSHRLAMAYEKAGKRKEGEKLVQEDLKIRSNQLKKISGMGAWSNYGSVYYDLAVDHALLNMGHWLRSIWIARSAINFIISKVMGATQYLRN